MSYNEPLTYSKDTIMNVATLLRDRSDIFMVTPTANIYFLLKSNGVTVQTIHLGRIKDANYYDLALIAEMNQ